MIEFSEANAPINEGTVNCFEQFLRSKLPISYKNFLRNTNGGIPITDEFNFKNSDKGSILHGFFGFTDNERLNILLRLRDSLDRILPNYLPVADDELGNLILLCVKGPNYGKVYFWDHELETDPPSDSNLTLIADSFEEFINNLKSEDEIDLD